MRMGAAALVVGASVLLSRVLGLAREALIAGFFGVSADADLYKQAFLIPDLLNYLLAGAYLTITLIPILSRHLEEGNPEKANAAFTSVFRFVTIAVVLLTLVMWVFADELVPWIFFESTEPERLVDMTRQILPAQVFLVVGALLIAVQYTHRKFVVPALAPLIYNLGIILGGLIGAAVDEPSPEAFLWGAVAGAAIGNFAVQWFGARRTGTWFAQVRSGESSIGEYLLLALPLMIGQSVAVLDEQFVRLFGQAEVGGTAALGFARQLNMVPVGVIAQAAGVAAFPFLARLHAQGKNHELVDTTSRAARNTVFVSVGAAALLVVLARPAVRLLYQYGQFTADDANLVADLLVIYAFSIPAWGLHQILTRHFYAKRRMWTPVLIGTAFSLVAIPIWIQLFDTLGLEGFALASTLVVTSYAIAMVVAWGFDSGWDSVASMVSPILRGLAAGAIAVLLALPVTNALFETEQLSFAAGLGALVVGGVTVAAAFLAVALLLRSPELAELRRGRQDPGQT